MLALDHYAIINYVVMRINVQYTTMKIGLFTECYLPQVNGVVYCVENIRKTLKRDGHQVFTFAPSDSKGRRYEGDVFAVKSIALGKTGYYFTYGFSREMQEVASKCDVLHTHHPFALARDALKISKKFNIPLIFTHHTQYYQYLPYVPKPLRGMAKKYLDGFLKKFCDNCKAIIAPSTGVQRIIEGYGTKTPVKVIHNGIELKKFQSSKPPVPEIFKKLKSDYAVILFVGRIAREKNIDFLISSFAKALKEYPKMYLMIVGDGPASESLKVESRKLVPSKVEGSGVDENVIFTGNVPREEIQNYYRAADIFASASKTEVHPLVGLEAQVSGLPIVALKSVGYEDIITNGENGYFAEETQSDFADKLIKLASNESEQKKMSAKAIETSKEHSIEKSVDKMIELYKSLTHSS
jgi:1,2-diacylglycerol 3-alpha-glucosyltransferase